MNAVKKILRSRSAPRRGATERPYVIESPTFTGTWVYTKGTIRRDENLLFGLAR